MNRKIIFYFLAAILGIFLFLNTKAQQKPILYISSGWETGSSSCGPCNSLAPHANQIKQAYDVRTSNFPSDIRSVPTLVDGNNKLTGQQDILKDLQQRIKNGIQNELKPIKCNVVPPGQSKMDDNAPMWGEPKVAQPEDVDKRPLKDQCPLWQTKPETCAQDFRGVNGKPTPDTVAEKRVDKLNWWFFKTNPTKEPLGVTSETDFDKLYPEAQKDSKEGGVTKKGQSNEAGTVDDANGQGKFVMARTRKEHQQYSDTYQKPRNGYTPQNGSDARVQPGTYTERTGYSADIPANNSTTPKDMTIDDNCVFKKGAGPGPSFDPNGWGGGNEGNNGGGGGPGGGEDNKMPQIPQIPQIPGGGGGNNQGQSPSPGTGNGSGTGNNNNNNPGQMSDGTVCTQNYNPVCGRDGRTYPNECYAQHSRSLPVEILKEGACDGEKITMSDGTECDGTVDQICGEDGKTYLNECVAQHFGNEAVATKEKGVCAGDTDEGSDYLNSFGFLSKFNSVIQQLMSEGLPGIPEGTLSKVMETISSMVSKFFNGNFSNII